MKKPLSLFLVLVALLLAAGAVWWFAYGPQKAENPTPLSTVVYQCDEGKFISAAFYEGTPAPAPAPGEPPTPVGSVELSLNGAASTTLAQTISASGVRYANTDESFVFWSKGDEALVMRNNAMDPAYTNCRTAAGYEGWSAATTNGVTFKYPNPFPGSYVSAVTWPPEVTKLTGVYTCAPATSTTAGAPQRVEKTIQGSTYCVTTSNEGAAGSTYVTSVYTTHGFQVTLVLRYPQCLNYDQPEQGACVQGQRLDVDALAVRILSSMH